MLVPPLTSSLPAVSDERRLTPDLLIRAYASGVFPMGDDRTGTINWYAPDPRAHLPLDDVHVPHNLRRRVRRREFSVTSDAAFEAVIRACADRERTWITAPFIRAYTALHEQGAAHSVECWQDGDLAGGLYGVALGGAFFGESMFFRVSHASKVALIHLTRQLHAGGFVLLDTQYATEHLERFGVTEIPRSEYERRLAEALSLHSTWWPLSDPQAAALDTPVDALSDPHPSPRNEEIADG
ncbi:MAG: leucyl/phenylalanyl-tRNA--protein transferase [Salinivenus sp.]